MKKWEAGKIILGVVALGGITLAALTLPGLLRAFQPFMKKRGLREQALDEKKLYSALRRLRQRHMVELVARDGKIALLITNEGKSRLRELEFNHLSLSVPRRWDGNWTIILFDIPEAKKTARDALRRKLNSLGCFQFHKSVFVHPASCEDEIDFVVEIFHLQAYVTVFRTKTLGDQEYRACRFFKLEK